MFIKAINNFKIIFLQTNSSTQKTSPNIVYWNFSKNNDFDSFTETTKPFSFRGSTSAGSTLKRIKDVITCPYFGIPMIKSWQIPKIDTALQKATTVKKAVHFLKKYENNMQETEKIVFQKFKEAAPNSPRMTFQDLLKQWHDDALIKLKLEEFRIVDKIDTLSTKLTPKTELAVRKITTECRKIILENSPENTFKRKTVLASIGEIQPMIGEEKILEEIKDNANSLPMSATSINAFIVKYSDRSHNEIARRLILPSVETIEHIVPDSLGGENALKNFLLTSAGANNLRQNLPFTKFLKRFPQIKKNSQLYIDKIISIINNGGLRGHETYPYKVKATLRHESKKQINLDLSELKYSRAEAKEQEVKAKNYHYKHKKT